MVDITTASAPVTHVHDDNHRGHHDGLSGKDAAFLAEGHVQARAVDDARQLGRVDRDLACDVKGNLIAVKDASLFTIDRVKDLEIRTQREVFETRELVRRDGERTRELLHSQKTDALAREVQDLKTDRRFVELEGMLRSLMIKVGAPV